jgi:hypothetical protein
MFLKITKKQGVSFALLVGFLACSVFSVRTWLWAGTAKASESPVEISTNFLPLLTNRYPWQNPFGVESTVSLAGNNILYNRAVDLHLGWIRLNGRISWRKLQPSEGGPIQWLLLANFEAELRSLKLAGLTPVVIVDDYPYWAVQNTRSDGKPTSCGPLQAAKFSAFAQFTRELVRRYKSLEFNVHHWELGNEPDVDPDLVAIDSGFGCWGNIDDIQYYGGQQYGEMLKIVAPAIRAEDPSAKIWSGGLLLATPLTTDPGQGHPENFLKGILQSGAASSFDVLPYHWYPSYGNIKMDYDLAAGTPWEAWGGGTVGKARYLRQIMQAFGVSKPLSLNETGLGCPNDWTVYEWCVPPAGPSPQFYQLQAEYVIRSFVRGFNEDIASLMWYTLNSPGWRYTNLLLANGDPKPVYYAYQTLSTQLQNTRKAGPVNYGHEIEAYAFRRNQDQIQVLWTVADTNLPVQIPQASFKAAFAWNGVSIQPPIEAGYYIVSVGFSPIYLVLTP